MIGQRHGPQTSPRRISRAPSPLVAYLLPWLSVVFASILPTLPMIAQGPALPPLGYLALLGWRQLHPGLLPVWAGLPLGLVDDVFSGQPMGSAMVLWSASMLALDIIEHRFPWRNFAVEWAVAAGMIVAYILATTLIARGGSGMLVAAQAVTAVLCYPIVGRVIAWADRIRLTRFRVIGG